MDMPIVNAAAGAAPNMIASDSTIGTEHHFRVAAGPGAGKTFWLVGHIRHVLQQSKILGKSRRIACITYTNTAVETIIRRLDFVADKVEVATIHSFLYHHIIRPYIGFIAQEFEIDATKIDGHDEHMPSEGRVRAWLENHPNRGAFAHPYSLSQMIDLRHNLQAILRWIGSIDYHIMADGSIKICADNGEAYYMENGVRRNIGVTTCLNKIAPGLEEYKRIFWRQGILHHEDILYFSYLLLQRYPFIVKVITAKFPYFFVDEFQDTSPIQTHLLQIFGQGGTKIGVIGDRAQSIYSFQGARPEQFESFDLEGLTSYTIADNRRSSHTIISLLNTIRGDLVQQPVRPEVGVAPILYIGDFLAAHQTAKTVCGDRPLAVLSWDNRTVNIFKRQMNEAIPTIDLLDEIAAKDSNRERRHVIIACMKAVELGREKNFKQAIRILSPLYHSIPHEHRKKKAVGDLLYLLSNHRNYNNQPLITFHQLIKDRILPDITGLGRGGAKTFYETYSYEQLVVCLQLGEDNTLHRTIHKAKGDEFDNVLLVLKKVEDITFLVRPNLTNTETHRLFYVGVSRARDRLFISVPTLTPQNENILRNYFDIQRV